MRLLACSLFAALATFGQTDRGTITGTISDPAGAVVANAVVEAKNTDTGQVYPSVSTTTGNYTIPQLPPGPYEIGVEVPGFKRYNRQGLRLSPTQIMRIDIALEVGSNAESVTVSAEATLLKTENSETSHNVTVSQMQNLPILSIGGNGTTATSGVRNPWSLVLLIPGTQFVSNSSMSINGSGTSYSIRVEGQDANMNDASIIYTQRVQPSVDAIQEVSVQTSNYAAEFGTVGGGIFNVTMKSGTNSYHGNLYDYAVNEALNAHQPYTGQRTAQKRHDYGGTLGGPVYIPKLYDGHNRTFFFWNFEQFRENALITAAPAVLGGGTAYPTVPIPAYRTGDFSQVIIGSGLNGQPRNVQVGGRDYVDPLGRVIPSGTIFDPRTERTVTANGQSFQVRDPFPGNKIDPSRFDPVAVRIQNLIPLPRGVVANQLGQNYQRPWITHRTTEIPSLKVDQTIGTKGHFSGYYGLTGTESQYSSPNGNMEGFPEPITAARGTFIHSRTIRLNYDHTLTPTMLLHVGAGYWNEDFDDRAPATPYDAEKELGLKGATLKRNFPVFGSSNSATAAPTSAIGGMSAMGPAAGIQAPSFEQKPTANLSLSLIRKNHTLKFGGEWRATGYPNYTLTNTMGNYTYYAPTGGLYPTGQTSLQGLTLSQGATGFGYANFLLGMMSGVTLSVPVASHTGQQQYALFAQDTWKVTRRLTFDYGLRWDYGTYRNEQYGRFGNFSASTPNPSASGRLGATIYEANCDCNFAKNYPYAFGPRAGFAYQINSKTVFRAGFGIVYSPTSNATGSATNSATAGTPAYGQPLFQLKDGIPSNVRPVWPAFDAATGQAPGAVVAAPGYVDVNAGRPSRQYQWSIGLQREITRNLVVDASYVANRVVWLGQVSTCVTCLTQYNVLSEQMLAKYGFTDFRSASDAALLNTTIANLTANQRTILAQRGWSLPYANFPATQTVRQSLLPFPQFTGNLSPNGAPVGKSWYDALQTTVTKRYSHGLSLNANFTWSKALDATGSQDIFNRAIGKDYSTNDRPFQFRLSAEYTTPRVRGNGILGNKVVSLILSDWGLGWYSQYQSAPILARPANASALAGTTFCPGSTPCDVPISQFLGRGPGSAQLAAGQSLWNSDWTDLDGNHHTDPIDINCHCFDPTKTLVLNPRAWQAIPNGQWAANAQSVRYFRGIRYPQENANFSRNFRIKERMSFQIRVEFTNIFNRTRLPQPATAGFTANPTTDARGLYSGGFGTIVPSSGTSDFRSGLMVARFQF